MDKIKNYAIAILTGLLVLSLFTQPAQSAPAKSKEAKAVEYHVCLDFMMKDSYWDLMIAAALKDCAKYRP
jgi:hypothetical protein